MTGKNYRKVYEIRSLSIATRRQAQPTLALLQLITSIQTVPRLAPSLLYLRPLNVTRFIYSDAPPKAERCGQYYLDGNFAAMTLQSKGSEALRISTHRPPRLLLLNPAHPHKRKTNQHLHLAHAHENHLPLPLRASIIAVPATRVEC
jgi:hypothetical protein